MLRTLQVNHGHTNYARNSVLCCSFGTAVSCTTKLSILVVACPDFRRITQRIAVK